MRLCWEETAMKELDGVRSWLVRVTTLSSMVLNAQNELDDLSVKKHYALAEENKKLWLKHETAYKQTMRHYDLLLNDLYRWTGCAAMADVTEQLTDVKVRFAQAYEAYQRWRTVLALVDTVNALGELSTMSDADMADTTQKVAKMRREYEVTVMEVLRWVPLDSELLKL